MSYQVGAVCYSSESAAASAIAAQSVGSVVTHSGAAFVVNVSDISASSISYQLVPFGGGATVGVSVPINLQPCGMLDWQDGLALGWAVAGVWIAVAAVLSLRRGLHNDS